MDKSIDDINATLGEKIMLHDLLSYLPTDILAKVDRAAMSVSLETRIPYLDHELVRFSFSLPSNFKINHGNGKLLLRDYLSQYIPKSIFERPKMGFAVPLSQWLRNELRDWAEDIILSNDLVVQGYFDPKIIETRWSEHLSGKYDWSTQLWCVLMFQLWYKNMLEA